jgi:hypothetical protein
MPTGLDSERQHDREKSAQGEYDEHHQGIQTVEDFEQRERRALEGVSHNSTGKSPGDLCSTAMECVLSSISVN